MDHPLGKTIDGKYQLLRLLGKGAMGCIYEAIHIVLNRKVAVKIMHDKFAKSRQTIERFIREAQAASSIDHPNIVEVYDIGNEDGGPLYIVMELLKGQSLEQLLKKNQTLPLDTAVMITTQVLSALQAASEKGIVHRDLKPANVFLTVKNNNIHEVKLLDFGIAKIIGSSTFEISSTMPGTLIGTPGYMSPEQARGEKEIDHRIDIWSAGVMLYEMISGALPFDGDTYNEVIGNILLASQPDLSALLPQLPPGLISVIDKALAKDRDIRYSSAAEMIEHLLPYQGNALPSIETHSLSAPPSPPPTPWLTEETLDDNAEVRITPPRRRLRIALIGAAGLFAAAFIVSGVVLLGKDGASASVSEAKAKPSPSALPPPRLEAFEIVPVEKEPTLPPTQKSEKNAVKPALPTDTATALPREKPLKRKAKPAKQSTSKPEPRSSAIPKKRNNKKENVLLENPFGE
ncbi:MAG: serine/threonine-protein kinase [Myxococcota bacterium]|nr:serine/threonine-protein kinase [Myxococcota bacterium]